MKKLFLLTVCFFLCTNILHGQAYWQVIGKKMPYPVSGGQVVYDLNAQSNKVYILGGYSDSLQQTVDWIQEYDVIENNWKIVGHMLQPRKQFVAGIWSGNAVYFGGAQDTSSDKTVMEQWGLNGAMAPYKSDSKADFGRSFFTGHIIGNTLFIIGGFPYAGGKISYITAYDLLTKRVSIQHDIASEDKPRDQMTFIAGENIYIFGGAVNGVIDKIQKFSFTNLMVENISQKLLEKRAGGAAVYIPQMRRGFLIGGYNETYTAMSTVEEVLVNNDGSLKISSSIPLNYARYNPMAVNYKGTVAVFGGKDAKGKVVPYVEILLGFVDVQKEELPVQFKLEQNYPNPFNPGTTIKYQLPKGSQVNLKIFDVLGRQVATLVDEYKNAGIYSEQFSVAPELPSGIYFAQLRVDKTIQTIKMLLLK